MRTTHAFSKYYLFLDGPFQHNNARRGLEGRVSKGGQRPLLNGLPGWMAWAFQSPVLGFQWWFDLAAKNPNQGKFCRQLIRGHSERLTEGNCQPSAIKSRTYNTEKEHVQIYICVNVYVLLCVTKINVFLTAFAMEEMIKTSCSMQSFPERTRGWSWQWRGICRHTSTPGRFTISLETVNVPAQTTHHVDVLCLWEICRWQIFTLPPNLRGEGSHHRGNQFASEPVHLHFS